MKSIYVGIIDDNIFERSESFTGQLISTDILPGTVYLEPAIATATIYDHKSIKLMHMTLYARVISMVYIYCG